MMDDAGKMIEEALPSKPVEVTGWKTLPESGEIVIATESEDFAKRVLRSRIYAVEKKANLEEIAVLNAKRAKEKAIENARDKDATEIEIHKQIKMEKTKLENEALPKLGIVLTADVHGSLEAIEQAISGLPQHQVEIDIIQSGVGSVSESDIDFAATTKAQIIQFNIPVPKYMTGMALDHNVKIHSHNIIYKLLDHVKDLMADLLPLEEVITPLGEAVVQQVFEVTMKKGVKEKVAGCRVNSGKIAKNLIARLMRNNEEVWRGNFNSSL